MPLVNESLIQQALDVGTLPDELTTSDLEKKLSDEWKVILANFGFYTWDLEYTRQEWIERVEYEPNTAAILKWLGAIKSACDLPTRLLFMLPLGERDYGRGDQDGEAIFTLFFEASGLCYRVTIFPLSGASSNDPVTFEPHTLATTLWAETGDPLFRSLTAFQWQELYGDRDPNAVANYFGSRSHRADIGPSGVKFNTEPPLASRATIEEARLDLVQMQARAVASVALSVGANRINMERDHVNLVLSDLKSQLVAVLSVIQ